MRSKAAWIATSVLSLSLVCLPLVPLNHLLIVPAAPGSPLGLECPKPFKAMKALAPGMIVPPPRVIVCGAPASGKGEQCEKILTKFGLTHVTTGSVIRQAIAAGTELGKEAQGYLLSGLQVPDELLTPLMVNALGQEDCEEHGWLILVRPIASKW